MAGVSELWKKFQQSFDKFIITLQAKDRGKKGGPFDTVLRLLTFYL